MKKITVPSKIEFMDKVLSFVGNELDMNKCPQKAKAQINIALDEIFTNIASYAYSEVGEVTVSIDVGGDPVTAVIELIDNGRFYNPLEKADPDTSLTADERDIGGLGIFVVKKIMDSLNYKYEDGKNILSVKKHLF